MKKILLTYILSTILLGIYSASASELVRKTLVTETVIDKEHGPVEIKVNKPEYNTDEYNVFITSTNAIPTILKIYDFIGNEKLSIEINLVGTQYFCKANLKDLQAGMYIFCVYAHHKPIASKKFIK